MDKDWRIRDSSGGISSSPSRSTSSIASPPPDAVGVNGGVSYILHSVSKFDTLAGVAIKYGVEVGDIKRLNGLVTDLQMFALKTLQIPLPGKHPPSPNLSTTPPRPSSSGQTSSTRRHSDLFDSFPSLRLNSSCERKVSPAMSSLQGYYGLKASDRNTGAEGFEMAVYRKGVAHYLEDGPFTKSSPISSPPLSHSRRSKSVASGFGSEHNDLINPLLSHEAGNKRESDGWIEKLVRQRQKSEPDFTSRTPEKFMKEENSSSSIFSAITGKGLALRPKSASRGVDGEVGGLSPVPVGLGDSVLTDSDSGVRKSSSASSLQDSENGALSSIWPTSKWSLKPDFQSLSTAAIARPIFDGLPKPMGRRNKTALD